MVRLKKHLFVGLTVMIAIILAVFLIREIPLMIKSNRIEVANEKMEETEISAKLGEQLKERGYKKLGISLSYSSLKDIDLTFLLPARQLTTSNKAEIEQIALDLVQANGFEPGAFRIRFDNLP